MRSRNSDFSPVSPFSFTPVRVAYGLAQAAGGLSAPWASTDVSVVRTNTGSYDIIFNPAFDGLPMVSIVPYGGQQYVYVIVGAGKNKISVVFSNAPGGAGIDTAFMFIAVGQQFKNR
jgi:hypothetical protein